MNEEFARVTWGLSHAPNVQVWFDNLSSLGKECGFEYTKFLINFRDGLMNGDVFRLDNYPRAWSRLYEENHYLQIDPVYQHCLARTSPKVWFADEFMSGDGRGIYEQATRYGVRAGVAFPIHGPAGEVGMLSFASAGAADVVSVACKSHLPALALVRDAAFETFLPHRDSQLRSGAPKLTPRESECLKWIARGKSSWEISRILDCSIHTVNFHVQNAKAKLNATSRSAAMMKAVSMGLIQMHC